MIVGRVATIMGRTIPASCNQCGPAGAMIAVPSADVCSPLQIIVLAQTKGGVGKSTLAVNLAIARSLGGDDTLLVDADEQATATDFTALRTERLDNPGYTAISLTGVAVRTHILRLAPKYQDIIIDVGGRDTTSLR